MEVRGKVYQVQTASIAGNMMQVVLPLTLIVIFCILAFQIMNDVKSTPFAYMSTFKQKSMYTPKLTKNPQNLQRIVQNLPNLPTLTMNQN